LDEKFSNRLAVAPHTHDGKKGIRTYHGFLRGLFLNEIARRVDPHHRMLDDILRDEILVPLGEKNEVYFGLPSNEIHRSATLVPFQFFKTLSTILLSWTGLVPSVPPRMSRTLKAIDDETTDIHKSIKLAIEMGDICFDRESFNGGNWHKAYLSSANAYSHAQAMAHAFSIAATGGTQREVEFWSPATHEQFMYMDPEMSQMYDTCLFTNTTFSNGGIALVDQSCEGMSTDEICYLDQMDKKIFFYGWPGHGGNTLAFSPQLGLTVAYMSNTLHSFDAWDVRGRELIFETVRIWNSLHGNHFEIKDKS
jgi:CubicO group peptidase (beta-lactamase class C family)